MIPVVPEKLRALVAPRRSLPGFAVVPTEKAAARELVRISKHFSKKQPGWDKSHKQIFAVGLDAKRDGFGPARKAAHAFWDAPSLEAVKIADIETLAFAEIVAHRLTHDADFTSVIVAARGALDAFSVMARALDLGLGAKGGYTTCVFVVELAEDKSSRWARDWLPLRHAICTMSDADYARAKKLALAERKKRVLAKRARIAFVFPDEPWAKEDLAEALSIPRPYEISFLLGSCGDAALIRKFVALPHQGGSIASHALDIAMTLPEDEALSLLGESLAPLLVKPKYGPLLKTPPREVAQAIALFPTKAAAEILAPYMGHAILGPIVAEFFHDAPKLRSALSEIAKGKTKAADAARTVLASGPKRASGPEANAADVPRVLVDRPWRPRKGSEKVVELRLAIPANAEERIELTPAEREPRFESENKVEDMPPAALKAWRAEVKKKDGYAHADWSVEYRKRGGVEYYRIPRDEGLRAWNERPMYLSGTYVEFLATHGTAAIPGFLNHDWVKWLSYQEVDDEPIVDVLAHIVSPRIAPMMARVVARRKNFRRPALAWLVAHPDTAALGLVPDALGKHGEARADAELALSLMAHKGQGAAISKVAHAYGTEAGAAIDALLARDPLAIDKAPPKVPDFLRSDELARVTTKAGARLPDDAMDALLEMLRVAPLDPPYPGIDLVRDACDAQSLGELARALVEQWVLAGSPGRFEWMLFSAAHFPSDDVTRRIGSIAREWARRDHKKAPRPCAVLAAIGTDFALLHVGHIAATSRFDDVREMARSLLEEAAAARELTFAELEDRIVPDLDLGAYGTIALSFGKRSFVVDLDEGLRPIVRGEKTFPRANKDDDAALAKAARARFDALKADAAAVADRQIRRFEQAMVTGRPWSAKDFVERVAKHPLLVHLARRLVWQGSKSFRVAEDGTFSDASDAVVKLDGESIRIAHPVRMTDDDRRAWTTLFADYRIVQPFEQLGRAVARASGAESRIARDITVAGRKVVGVLETRGWRRNDRGHVTAYLRTLGNGGEARIELEPGVSMEDVKGASDQKITGAELPAAASALDPVDYAEIARDLDALL